MIVSLRSCRARFCYSRARCERYVLASLSSSNPPLLLLLFSSLAFPLHHHPRSANNANITPSSRKQVRRSGLLSRSMYVSASVYVCMYAVRDI